VRRQILPLVPEIGVLCKGLEGVEQLPDPTIRRVDAVRGDVVPNVGEILIRFRA
jgi:hypothetical protein